MYRSRSKWLLFPTLVQLTAGRPMGLADVYEQVWYHVHLGSAILEDIASDCRDAEQLYEKLQELVPDGFSEISDREAGISGDISVELGNRIKANERVSWSINDTSVTENPHAAIIGLSGQGKTQFVLDLLYQIHEQSPETTFTVLDYKGDLSEANSTARAALEDKLGCEVIEAGTTAVPTVPFLRIEPHDAQQYALGVTDLMGRLYPQQRLALREVLAELIDSPDHPNGFGFETLGNRLSEFYEERGRKEDGLTEVVSRLNVLRVFEEDPPDIGPSLVTNSTLVRLNELIADSLPVAFMIVSRIYDEMKRLPDTTREGSLVNIRHIIFIDEAHHYLPIRSSPLTGIIREGRSKGVAVFLATQSVSDLSGAAGADYREFLSNTFFFKTNIGSTSEIRALLPTTAQRVQGAADLIPGLEPGQMLFSKQLERNLRDSVLSAVQLYKRTS